MKATTRFVLKKREFPVHTEIHLIDIYISAIYLFIRLHRVGEIDEYTRDSIFYDINNNTNRINSS